MRLLSRLFLILLAAAVLPVGAAGVWFLHSSRQFEANARVLHRQIAALSADMIEKAAQDANRAFGFVFSLENARRSEMGDLRILQQAVTTHPEFVLLALLDRSGRETIKLADRALFPEPERLDRSKDPLVARARSTGRLSVGNPESRSGAVVLGFAYPLSDGACVVAAYSLQSLFQRLQGLKMGDSGRVVTLDGSGAPLPGIAGDLLPPGWRLEQASADASGWLDDLRVGKSVYVGAYAPAPSFGWRVLTLQPRAAAFALSEGFKLKAAMFLLLLTLLVVLQAYWLAEQLTRPMGFLVGAARRVCANDFSRPLPPLGWGELDELGGSFNEMMKTLKSYQDMQVERQLDEKAKVDALVQTIPDGIALAAFDGNLLFINAAGRSILASHGAPGRAKTVKDIARIPGLADIVNALISRSKKEASAEIEVKLPEAKKSRTFLCQGVSVSRERREIGVLFLLRDVTADRELARMKEEFFHSIVHDLRGPIGAIDGFIHLIGKQAGLGEKGQSFIGHVRSSTERLRTLVSDILDSAKMEAGQLQLRRQEASPEQMVLSLKTIYHLQAEEAGVDLRLEAGEEPQAPLSCDRELIERVLMNLVGNALKFTPRGGSVTARCACLAAEEEFSVCDTGPGIPEDKLEAVFEKFRQLDRDAEARVGYGLGLSICRKIVELHGGRIWAESKPGQGSRFVFRIPLKAA